MWNYARPQNAKPTIDRPSATTDKRHIGLHTADYNTLLPAVNKLIQNSQSVYLTVIMYSVNNSLSVQQ